MKIYNPIIPDNIADPSIVEFDGTYYLYATADVRKGIGVGPPVVWKSTDFVNWSFRGCIIPDVDWKKVRYWAPGRVIRRDGQYYLYFTGVDSKDGKEYAYTHVAVSNHPEGPFVTPKSPAFIFAGEDMTKEVTTGIDGDPFLDDDGKAYIAWGLRKIAELKEDWLDIKEETLKIIPVPDALDIYSEGSWLFKRNNIYYYLYTLYGHYDYMYGYSMSKTSPLGEYTIPSNPIISKTDKEKGIWGPGHGCIFQPDEERAIFTYLEFGEGGNTRQVHCDWVEFDENNEIKPIKLSWEGVGPLKDLPIERVNYATQGKGIKVTTSSQRPDRVIEAWRCIEEEEKHYRTMTFGGYNAVEEDNRHCWQAAEEDINPTFIIEVPEVSEFSELEFSPTWPTLSHQYKIEKSLDGVNYEVILEKMDQEIYSPHVIAGIGNAKFIKITFFGGKAGIWRTALYK